MPIPSSDLGPKGLLLLVVAFYASGVVDHVLGAIEKLILVLPQLHHLVGVFSRA
jgi:hypothetical protein